MTRLLAPADAAAYLGISAAQLTRLRASGKGPDWGRVVGSIRYDVDDLDAWAAEGRVRVDCI